MIGGPGPIPPNLLRQLELGEVPRELAEEQAVAGSGDEERMEGKEKRTRRHWLRFWRNR